MTATSLLFIGLSAIFYAAISKHLERAFIAPPLAFAAFGYAFGEGGLGLIDISFDSQSVRTLADVALAIFIYAAGWGVRDLRAVRDVKSYRRLAFVAAPLTLIVATLIAFGFFPHVGIWGALLIAATASMIDLSVYGFGAARVRAPVSFRRMQNAEAAFQMTLFAPLALIFAYAAASDGTLFNLRGWAEFFGLHLVAAAAIGAAIGAVQARWLLPRLNGEGYANLKRWVAWGSPLVAFSAAELLSANGFIAAFSAGLAGGIFYRADPGSLSAVRGDDTAECGLDLEPITLFTYLAFGAVLLPEAIAGAPMLAYSFAFLLLFFVRPFAVAAALSGSRLKPPTVMMLAWSGPQGVMSALLLVVAMRLYEIPEFETIYSAVVISAGMSLLAHGLTARPGISWYARQVAAAKRRAQGGFHAIARAAAYDAPAE